MPENPYSPRSLMDGEFHSLVRSDPWPLKGWPAPPPGLRHNRLAWYAACCAVEAVAIRLPGDIEDTATILRALIATGQPVDIAGAWAEYAKRWGLKRVVLPLAQFHGAKLTWLHRGGAPRGSVTIMTNFSLPLAVWLLLSEPEVCRRIRLCPECATFFLDATQNRSKRRCSRRCTSRVTSRDHRAAGKERERRQQIRVTSLPKKNSRR